MQTKFRSNEHQLRQSRLDNDRLNDEISSSRRAADQQILALNNRSQDSLKKITGELERTLQRLNDYERFINVKESSLFTRMIIFVI